MHHSGRRDSLYGHGLSRCTRHQPPRLARAERGVSLFTVGRVYELLVQPRERVAAGIVGYRCAGQEDRRSQVEREGANDREKRQPAYQGSLAPTDAISRHF